MSGDSGTAAAIAGGNAPAQNGAEAFDAQVAAAREQYQPTTSEKILSIVKSLITRGLIFYFVMSFFRKPTQAPQQGNAGPGSVKVSSAATNLFENGTLMDLYIYLANSEESPDFKDPDNLIWFKEDLIYGDWYSGPDGEGVHSFTTKIPATPKLQNNGSIYMHSYIVKSGKSPDPEAGKGSYSRKWTVHTVKRLNKFKKKQYKKTSNLLTGQTETSEEDLAKMAEGIKQEIISHWHPNVTILFVVDYTPWTPGQVPVPLDEFIEFTPSLQNYKPILFYNDYWNLNRDYMPINETVKELNLTVMYQPVSMFKWQMYSSQQMKNRFNMMSGLMGEEEEDDDQDSIKEAFLETNIYLLVLTFVVSIVHSVFEFLAFKNDIQFWNNRKSLEGLSVRSVFFNVFQSAVVLLYVLDNETNTVIKISCFVGLCIEFWKITKVSDVKLDFENKILGVVPRPLFEDKGDYDSSGTKEFDRMAFKYLGMAFFPLAMGYCIYSMIYNEHKSWYSFVLSSTYGFLLTFGFIMMTPQLFINYKMKSVAHLPWRMLTYKALNTFIDDIFAFVIKMPTMYRLGCFRDDIVFFIFLYQRYIYRVDYSRVNEFGVSGDMLEEAENKKDSENKAVKDESQNGDSKKENGFSSQEQKQTKHKPKSAKAKKAD